MLPCYSNVSLFNLQLMLDRLQNTLSVHAAKLAFCIQNESFTYFDLERRAAKIAAYLELEPPKSHFVALITQDTLDTYASILAIWSRGLAYVPLSPAYPKDRNMDILAQVETDLVLCSDDSEEIKIDQNLARVVLTKDLLEVENRLEFKAVTEKDILCILFTSGSTGVPKGVPFTKRNIESTMAAFFDLGFKLSSKDKVLQMFEMTFDMSLFSFLMPWYIGAGIYTVPQGGLKYLKALKVMINAEITFAAMVPSTLTFLKPYFKEIHLPEMRYLMLGGEMFMEKIARSFYDCIPNALMYNGYGPCETTIWCAGYALNRNFDQNKSFKGGLAIGEMWSSTTAIIVDEKNEEVRDGIEGELCLSGENAMIGYWKNADRNEKVFFTKETKDEKVRFYKSGDRAFKDKEGTYFITGRADHQYKIRGQKVELGELESIVKEQFDLEKVYALVNKNEKEVLEIYLTVEKCDFTVEEIMSYTKSKLPPYTVPKQIFVIEKFPLTLSGKIDRNALLKNILNG